MKVKNTILAGFTLLLGACALDEPEVKVEDNDFPFRLLIDELGAGLPDAEDYGIEVAFADYLDDLPNQEITLTYELSGTGDFATAAVDKITYEYEDNDCVFVRELAFTTNTLTIPVDPDMGTVPESFEIMVLINSSGADATNGEFSLEITALESSEDILLSEANVFEYGILDNDLAGEWILSLEKEADFIAFQEVLGTISSDLSGLSFDDITGVVKVEFGFEELKIEMELVEKEEVVVCEDGAIETEVEHLIIEIEAEYDAEDGELTLEGSHVDETGETLDFIIETKYELGIDDNTTINITSIIDEDHFESGEELFSDDISFTLTKD